MTRPGATLQGFGLAMPRPMPATQQRKQELDPAVAWLILPQWGQGNHVRARFRTVKPLFEPIEHGASLLDRWLALVCPWKVYTYPPRRAILTAICEVRGSGMIARWRREGIPPAQAERLARFLESRVAREVTLIEELRADAERRRAEKPRPYFARDLTKTERQLIVARKRAERAAAKPEAAARALRKSATGRLSSDGAESDEPPDL
jgi:hypothetical protein